MKILLLLVLTGLVIWFYINTYGKYPSSSNQPITVIDDISYDNNIRDDNITDEYIDPNLAYEEKLYRSKTSTAVHSKAKFKCDGRQYCSQMHSCEEAKFFLSNCPNTKMDGGRPGEEPDGIPCERQWCH